MKDRTLSKQIKGEAKSKSEKASAAIRDSNFELAVELAQEALEMCHRCEDQDLLAAAETIKNSAVSVAKETYTVAVDKLKTILADVRIHIDTQKFEGAKTRIQDGFEILQTDNLMAAIRALQHVDPFQDYPTMEDELSALSSEVATRERTFKAHKAFGLKQGMVQMKHTESMMKQSMATLKRAPTRRLVKNLYTEVLDIADLVQHNDDTSSRIESLKNNVETLLQAQNETDQGVLKHAARLQQQAETQLKHCKFLEAKRLALSSQAHLIQAEAKDDEFTRGENVLAAVKAEGVQALRAKALEFIRLSENALDAFEQGKFQRAVELANDCQKRLGECVNDQLLCGVVDPCSNSHASWMLWAESTAQEISKFRELLHALAFVCIVSPPSLTSFDILTSSECPTHMHPVISVARFYTNSEMMPELPKDVPGLTSHTDDNGMGTSITASDALDILEGNLESPVVKTLQSPHSFYMSESGIPGIDWSVLAQHVREHLNKELTIAAGLAGLEEEEDDFQEEEALFEAEDVEDADDQEGEYQDDDFDHESKNSADEASEHLKDAEAASDGNASTLQSSARESNAEDHYTPVSSRPSTAPDPPMTPSKEPPSPPAESPSGEAKSDAGFVESPVPIADSSHEPVVDASPTAKAIDLVDAIERGDFAAAQNLVDNGADVNATQIDGENFLLKLVKAKDCPLDQVRFLLEHGAHVRDVDSESRQILHLAALHDRGDVVEEVAASADSSSRNRDAESVNSLLHDMLDAKDKDGKTPIELAQNSRCMNALGNLVSLGADTLALGSDGLNCLHRAIKQDYHEEIPLLLDSTKNLERKTAVGMSSLMLACEKGNQQLVELLVSRGSKVNVKDLDGRTPLHISARAGNQNLMRTLLDKGAETDHTDAFGWSPAYYCIAQGHMSCLDLLSSNPSTLNQTVNGNSLLYVASYLGRIDMVNHMVNAGCSLFVGCKFGFAPLHAATCMGHTSVVETLSKAHAAEADSQSRYAQVHRIAQCLAVIRGNADALQALQDHAPKQDLLERDPVLVWDAAKLAALLGRNDLLALLKVDVSAVRSRPSTAETAANLSLRVSSSTDADVQVSANEEKVDASAVTAETGADLSLRVSSTEAEVQINANEENDSCGQQLLPVPRYLADEDTDHIVSDLLGMLFSDRSNVRDIVGKCLAEHINIVKSGSDGASSETIVGSDQYHILIRNLIGGESMLEKQGSTLHDSNTTVVEVEEHVIYACYPMPVLSNPEERQALLLGGSAQLHLPDEIESRLLAEDKQLREMIREAEDRTLEKRRFVAAKMRVQLKQAKLASIAGSAEEAMDCLNEASLYYGQCSVCLQLKNLESNSLHCCRVCELSKQLHQKMRQTVINTLFSFNMESAEKYLSLKQSLEADRALRRAQKWLDDILGDDQPMSKENKEKKSRWVQLEAEYIHSQVTAQIEDLLRKVCSQDASRRSKMAIRKYSEELAALIPKIFDLLKAFENHQCKPEEITGRIEDLNVLRISFMRAGDLVSKSDYDGLERIQHVVAGISNLSQASTRVKDGLSKSEEKDGFSLLLARKCALECQGLCTASRNDLRMLDSHLVQQSKDAQHVSDGFVLRTSSLLNATLMQELENLRAQYVGVAIKVMDGLEKQCESLLKRVNEQQTLFLEEKMEEAVSDLISDLEVEEKMAEIAQVESKLVILEQQARQQYLASEYAKCLESIAEWNIISETGAISRSQIASAFQVLTFQDEITYLRQQQMQAEATLSEAEVKVQSDAEQARQLLVVAQAKFKDVNETRPEISAKIAKISHAIVTAFVEIIVKDNIVNAAMSSSENARFRAAKIELQSSLYVAQGHLEKDDLDHCIKFADQALLNFSSQIAELSASAIDMSVSEQLVKLREEAKGLVAKDAAAALTEEQLASARSIYNGVNYDDARLQLSVARDTAGKAGHRLKGHVIEALDAFARALDTDEIGSVWKRVVSKVEEYSDTEISAEIAGFVKDAVADVASDLSELFGAGTVPTEHQLDALAHTLLATIERARKRASHLSRPHPTDDLWAAAVGLLQECRHLSECSKARRCLDDYLVSIHDYQNGVTKKLPMRRLRTAKDLWQAASASALGPSELYVIPADCGIQLDVLRALLQRCEDETEKSIDDTKQRITECMKKQASAVEQVLAGDFAACEQLLSQVVEMDMVLNPAFWKRHNEIEVVASTSRRRADLEAVATQEYETTKRLLDEEVTLSPPPRSHAPHALILLPRSHAPHALTCMPVGCSASMPLVMLRRSV